MIICNTCKVGKEEHFFYKSNTKICKECLCIKSRLYNSLNKERYKNYQKEYRLKYSDEKLEKKKEHDKEYAFVYHKKKDVKEKRSLRRIERRREDNIYRVKSNVRVFVGNAINRKGYKKNTLTQEIIGCSYKELVIYLESKFEPWMNWENYGKYNGELNYGWDIDHIIPISSASTEEEIYKLNHYINLQPLCSKINRDIKINKLEF